MSAKTTSTSKRVPKLRFPEFQNAPEWEEKKLGDMGRFIRGLTYSSQDVDNTGLLVLRSSNIQDNNLVLDKDLVFVQKKCSSDLLLKKGDVAICMSNGSKALVGKNAEYDGSHKGSLTVGAFCSIFRSSNRFARLMFQTEKYNEFVAVSIGGGNINNLKNSILEEYSYLMPSDEDEQQRIADCLSSLDEWIAAEAKRLEALKDHKKGLMQQLFPAEGETTPKLRFPEFQNAPEWENKTLKDLAIKRTKRNRNGALVRVLTNSAEYGVVDQRDYFDKDIANQGSIESYFIVAKGDFVYNPRISAHAPVGPLSRNNIADGVMSPLYTILRFKRQNSDFHEYYFQSSAWHSYMRRVGNTGARHDRMSIASEDFMAMPIPDPSPAEQASIADCLSSLDEWIAAQAKMLDALKDHKKGLMQQLFPSSEEDEA